MNWTLMEIIEATMATPSRLPKGSLTLTGISTDSRTLSRGELFVALKGPRFDGHRFVDAALSRGAGAILAQDPVPCDSVPCLFVPDTLHAYGRLGNACRKRLEARMVAVTGSMGKTSTKEMAAAILSRKHKVAKTDKNENNRVGVPKTLLKITPETERAVIELGSNIPGEIALLTEIVQPDVALLTNIAPVHLERFKTLDGVRIEKSALFWRSPSPAMRCINRNDPHIREIPLMPEWPTLTYGLDEGAHVRAGQVRSLGLKGSRFTLLVEDNQVEIDLPLLGLHQVKNALAAAAVGIAEGIPLPETKKALESLRPQRGRLEPIFASPTCVILDDTYNANPDATIMALQTLASFKHDYFTVALLGDMKELGDEAGRYHEGIGEECARLGIGLLGLIGSFREMIRKGAIENGLDEERVFSFDDDATLLDHLSSHLDKPVMILVKGSHSLRMGRWIEAILSRFKGKGGNR